MKAVIFVAALLVSVSSAHAASYDGSTPMKCAIQTVLVCHDPSGCVRGTAQTISFPPVVTVDVQNRLISGSAIGRTARIISVARGSGRLMLHGQEVETLGNAWDIVVEEASGAMTGAVLSHGGGFLLFGACAAP